MADALPVCAVADVAVLPVRVQPVKPCSNPPLVMPLVGAGVTVSETVVLWVALGDVPVSEIVSAAPLVMAVEIVEVPEPPWAIETLVGFALIEKSFATGAVTVSVTVVPCV